MSRALICIQPNICVDAGAQEVPEPSWDIGSARSVVDRISCAPIDILSVPIGVGLGDGVAASIVGIGLAGELLGEALGAGVVVGAEVGEIEARGLGLAGRIVMAGMGPMLIPGIGVIVDCADGAPVACTCTAIRSKAKLTAMPAMRKAAVI
jgi:hypothetical protein